MYKVLEKLIVRNRDNNGYPPATIACLGDSVTQGCFELYLTGEGKIDAVRKTQYSYCTKLGELLRSVFPNAQLNIINAGISGNNTLQGLERLDRDVLRFSPDLVTVCFGLNDCCNGESFIDTYSRNLGEIFDRCLACGADVIFLTPNCMNTRVMYEPCEVIKNMAKRTCEIQNAGGLSDYLDAAKRECVKRNIGVCDCYAIWDRMAKAGVDVTSLLSNGINHPKPEMHRIFAYELFRMIMGERI